VLIICSALIEKEGLLLMIALHGSVVWFQVTQIPASGIYGHLSKPLCRFIA
jgi:hypothetical protein